MINLIKLFSFCYISLFFLFDAGITHGQPNPDSKLIDLLCKKHLVSEDFCDRKQSEGNSDVFKVLREMLQQAEVTSYDEQTDRFTYSDYNFSQYERALKHQSQKAPAGPADYAPLSLDSFHAKHSECVEMLKLISKYNIVDAVQKARLKKVIEDHKILHPWYLLAATLQLLTEDYLSRPETITQITNDLKTVFGDDGKQYSNLVDFSNELEHGISFDFHKNEVIPEQCALLIHNTLAKRYNILKSPPSTRIEKETFAGRCNMPIRRDVTVISWPLGMSKHCEIEFDVLHHEGKAFITINELTQSSKLTDLVLQLEQEQNSEIKEAFLISLIQIRNKMLANWGVPIQDDVLGTPSNKDFFSFAIIGLTEKTRARLKKCSISLQGSATVGFHEEISERTTDGMTLQDKIGFWDKLQSIGFLDRYSPEAKRYIWANISASPIADSLEMTRQLYLSDYPGIEYGFKTINQILTSEKSNNLWPIDFLVELSNKTVKNADFGKFIRKGGDNLLFDCGGKTYTVFLGQSLEIVLHFAMAWNEKHAIDKYFYYIPNTKGYLMFLSKQEAYRFSEATNLFLQRA